MALTLRDLYPNATDDQLRRLAAGELDPMQLIRYGGGTVESLRLLFPNATDDQLRRLASGEQGLLTNIIKYGGGTAESLKLLYPSATSSQISRLLAGEDLHAALFQYGGTKDGSYAAPAPTFPNSPDPTGSPTPLPPTAPPPPTTPDPTPDPDTTPDTPAPVDWNSRARALYPWLPEGLLSIFANSWAETGDTNLALAYMRSDSSYEQYFPGIKRDDGSLRMTEAQWFSTREAYSTLFREYGLNDSIFSNRFTELMEGDVSPAELAARLGGAYSQIISNLPEVRQAYSQWFGDGEMTDAAIFASFIDADVSDAILNRRIAISQVGAEGLSRGFSIDEDFATSLVTGGLSQATAREFFVLADGQLSNLDALVQRHNDPDDDFDLEEFADANVFGDAVQNRRIQRALRAEAASFTDQLGGLSTDDAFRIEGLSQR